MTNPYPTSEPESNSTKRKIEKNGPKKREKKKRETLCNFSYFIAKAAFLTSKSTLATVASSRIRVCVDFIDFFICSVAIFFFLFLLLFFIIINGLSVVRVLFSRFHFDLRMFRHYSRCHFRSAILFDTNVWSKWKSFELRRWLCWCCCCVQNDFWLWSVHMGKKKLATKNQDKIRNDCHSHRSFSSRL